MTPSQVARCLSIVQRNRLISFVPGPQAIDLSKPTDNSLRAEKLLKPESGGINNPRPSGLMLTDLGREVSCIILGQFADALVACGVTEWPLTELQLAAAIKESSRRKPCPPLIDSLSADAGSVDASAPNIPRPI